MAAFDKTECGFQELDGIFDHIRMGDNVVWQVENLNDFCYFAEPFARQAVKDGRNIIYIHFSGGKPLLEDLNGIKVFEFDPDAGFESFTVSIYERITEEGRDAFYVFDCLSELQSAWYTDLMMGNFFRVTCPYLFSLDTVAFFPVLRGRHSFDAIARIRDTTQLLLDVHAEKDNIYVHPIKVWNRYSTRMFLPHHTKRSEGKFHTVEDGVAISHFYQMIQQQSVFAQDQNFDSYERFFSMAKREFANGRFRESTENLIIESSMTRDQKMRTLVKQYFKPHDYFKLWDRMIGSGAIGGKACGMLLARKIIETEMPESLQYGEAHDSFYIGSDVFYTYIVSNDCWNLRIRQRTDEGFFGVAAALKEKLLTGTFPSKIRDQFRNMLDHFGQIPIVVRSSSFLEDGFENAFAGKYESVFMIGQGTPEERLEAFEQAVRTVYASTMDISALEYRMQRGLQKHDEQMAVLVQRVSGSYYGKYYMPGAAGVGYSRSMYQWSEGMDPAAGMLRIVMGLGTKAVDRTATDYPRLANLDRPAVSSMTTVAQKHRFSQRMIDVLDFSNGTLHGESLDVLLAQLPDWYKNIVMERDNEAEYTLRQRGVRREVWFVSCQHLLENKAFTQYMQQTLRTLERVYQNPVDIEYTVNFDERGSFVVNLVQCRPLYVGGSAGHMQVPQLSQPEIFFETKGACMGPSMKKQMDVIVQIDPKAYYEYPYAQKYEVAAAIRSINQNYKGLGKNLLLMTPGRIGTSSPELGVPVVFADISGFSGICEISDASAGYMPELSYGSHMFQDLVETETFYNAIWENEKTLYYFPDLFRKLENRFLQICPSMQSLASMIFVYEPQNLTYWMDSASGHALCGYTTGILSDDETL